MNPDVRCFDEPVKCSDPQRPVPFLRTAVHPETTLLIPLSLYPNVVFTKDLFSVFTIWKIYDIMIHKICHKLRGIG